MPTLYQNTPAGQHEEAWLRQKILSGLNKDEKIAMSVESSDNVVARKELDMDKLAIQMIDVNPSFCFVAIKQTYVIPRYGKLTIFSFFSHSWPVKMNGHKRRWI